MNIMAIDPSLTGTGWAVISNSNGGNSRTYSVIKSKEKGYKRLLQIRDTILGLVKEYKIEKVYYEGYSYGSKFGTFYMGEIGGILKLALYEIGLEPIIIPIGSWKKFLVNSGMAKKEQILMQVFKRYGNEFKDNNIADAYVMLRFAEAFQDWKLGNNNTKFTQYELQALENFDKSLEVNKDGE